MDRDLTPDIRRRHQARRIVTVVAPLMIVALALIWLPGWLRPSVSRTRVRIATVAAGAIDATITASGLIVPEVERVVSSPLDARVLRILKRPGAALTRGDAVLELDVSESRLELERAEYDLRIADNEQAQARLTYEKTMSDLRGQEAVKALALEAASATLVVHQELGSQGLLSGEDLRRSEVAVRQAEVELAQVREAVVSASETTDLQLEGLSLERAMRARDVAERRRLLELATTKADRDGVLTWVVDEEGALVRRGDVLARIADLSSYRVEATVSDVHAGRVRPGLPVFVRIDGATLDGQVREVYPTVENGTIRLTVALAAASDPRLRPSLRADVDIVTDRRTRALTVTRGPFADGTADPQVFVVDGDRAIRTPVRLGVANFDEVEIVAGLDAGDEIIVSDMRDYLHLEEIRIR